MNFNNIAKIGIGLLLLGPFDELATGGASLAPSTIAGLALLGSGLGVKMPFIDKR